MTSNKVDRQVIIAWNSNKDLIKVVEDTFGGDILLKKEIKLTPAERADKINKMYAPIHVPHNSSRCNFPEPLTIFVVKMEPKYKYYLRTEGYLLCNSTILEFKIKYRKIFNFELFHCSDSVEEAKKAMQVFGISDLLKDTKGQFTDSTINNEIIQCSVVPVENLYNIRHLADDTIALVKLRDSVVVQNLMGYDTNYLDNKFKLKVVNVDNVDYHISNETSLNFFKSLPDFDQTHEMCEVTVYKKAENQYVVIDGKHRAATLYFKGDRHIFVRESTAPFAPDHMNSLQDVTSPVSHLENLHKIIYSLHSKDIRYVVARGYKTMPKTADTDLDVIIHPEDYPKFLQLMAENIKNGIALFNVEKLFKQDNRDAWYRAYRTPGIYDDFLSNKDYQMDTYSSPFFFASQDKAIILSDKFIKYLFDNKKKHLHLNVPDELSEMILLFCRTYIDLGGNWKAKHRSRFDQLKQLVTKDKFIENLKDALENRFINYAHVIDGLFK